MRNKEIFLVLCCIAALAFGFAQQKIPVAVGAVQEAVFGDFSSVKGPASLNGANNVSKSVYYTRPDFYNMQSNAGLTILPHFKTAQQETEYSCGPACALMVMRYLDANTIATEQELCKEMHTSTVKGTRTVGMVEYFKKKGTAWGVESCLTMRSPQDDKGFKDFIIKRLREGKPIIVENIEWGGHWRVIIGYDSMGTDSIGDDVVIMAEPYDTTDHYQDGYTVSSAQRLFYMWFDAHLFPTDEQNKQWLCIWKK